MTWRFPSGQLGIFPPTPLVSRWVVEGGLPQITLPVLQYTGERKNDKELHYWTSWGGLGGPQYAVDMSEERLISASGDQSFFSSVVDSHTVTARIQNGKPIGKAAIVQDLGQG